MPSLISGRTRTNLVFNIRVTRSHIRGLPFTQSVLACFCHELRRVIENWLTGSFPHAYHEQGPMAQSIAPFTPGHCARTLLTFIGLAWQTTERASVRLAARGSAPDPRYGDAAYYHTPGNGVFATSAYPQHSPQPPEPLYSQPSPPQLPQPPQPPRVVQPPPEKRHRSEEGDAGPKSKRSKSTTAKTPGMEPSLFSVEQLHLRCSQGASKRGYNAKKRSEAAQIAAQQGARFSPLLCIRLSN